MVNVIESGHVVFSTTHNGDPSSSSIWFDTPASGQYLYHYTTLRSLGLILKSNQIKFSSLRNTNDPREYKNIPLQGWYNKRPWNELDRLERAESYLRDNWYLSCFCMDEDLYKHTTPTPDRIQFRGFTKPRMWAQYGDNHAGVCMVFDRSELCQTFEKNVGKKLRHGSVKYASTPPNYWSGENSPYSINLQKLSKLFGIKYLRKHVQLYCDEFFFKKHPDWSTESEYRFVLEEAPNRNVFVAFNEALCGIAFGEKTKKYPKYVSKLAACLHSAGLSCCRLEWKGPHPEPKPIDIGDGWANM